MKSPLLFFFAALLLTSSCVKPYNPPAGPSGVHFGKVVGSSCGSIIIQFTDGSPWGQNHWFNPISSLSYEYNHVFKVANPCTWGGAEVNDVIQFKFVEPQVQNCALCKIYVPTPDTAYNIERIF